MIEIMEITLTEIGWYIFEQVAFETDGHHFDT
jgi:hypothetical protein